MDGDIPTYAIAGGADADLFTVDPVTGGLSFVTAPDFETPGSADGDNVYDVSVSATDPGGLSDVQSIAVTVTDVDENGEPSDRQAIGKWEFSEDAPSANTASGFANQAAFINGPVANGGVLQLDGDDDHVRIDNIPEYGIEIGGVRMVFSVDELSGKSAGANFDSSNLQALFSRDSSGFDGGGHLTAYVDGDGSIVVRHQTQSESYVIRSEANLFDETDDVELIYQFDPTEGMKLFLGLNGSELSLIGENSQAIADGDPVDLTGNAEPWTLGASQARSSDNDADRLQNHLDGEINSFEAFTTADEFIF